MTENWIVIAACFTSGILSSLAGLVIGYQSRQKRIDTLESDLKVYKKSLESKDAYISSLELTTSIHHKALGDIQQILHGVHK